VKFELFRFCLDFKINQNIGPRGLLCTRQFYGVNALTPRYRLIVAISYWSPWFVDVGSEVPKMCWLSWRVLFP